ncbi:MAG: hypothetical protein JXB50_10330 [Spirochaetes bacterium]|nr:hypothetical protein [Spirochaetota bacterium]
MKLKLFFIILVFLISIKINVFTQSREEIRDKFNAIISQEKYSYEIEMVDKAPKKESGFIKVLNQTLAFITKVFKLIGKLLTLLWNTSPVVFILVMISLLLLLGLFVFWVVRQINISFGNKVKNVENLSYEELHFDYIKEIKIAKKFIAEGKFKEAISILTNALWLFYYHKKILKYDKSRTNREYLKILKNLNNYDSLKQLIFKAEKAVYYKDKINEGECEEILSDVSEIFSQ